MISVIVPVYNVEEYLDRCISSIVNQTYKNLEIILVDDGSTDSSNKKCDEWAKKDKRIKVIHKENGGLSSARNAGLKIATGDYISFIDSDDYIDLDSYKIIKENNLNYDIIVFNYYNDYSTNKEIGIKTSPSENFEKEMYKTDSFKTYAWNRIYKKELINNISFNESIKVCEDILFNCELCNNNKKINYKYIDKPLYYYYKNNPNSICNRLYSIDTTKFKVGVEVIKHIETFDIEMAKRKKMQFIIDYNDYKIINKKYKEDKIFINLLPNYKQYKKEIKNIKLKFKIKIFLSEHFNKFYFKIRNH